MRLAPPPRTAPAMSAAPRFWVPGTKARPTPATMVRAVPHLEELAFGLAVAVELLGGDGVQAGDVEVCDLDWTAGRVSDSSKSGLSGCLSYCSVLLVDLALRPVPQGGVESFLIVFQLDLGGNIPDGLASCGIHHLIDPLVP